MINITRLSFHLACDVMHFKTVHTRRAQQVTLGNFKFLIISYTVNTPQLKSDILCEF